MKRIGIYFSLLCLVAGISACQQEQDKTSASPSTSRHAIASAHPTATQAGIDILNQGGNAFDAAVAVSATLAVVEPYSSGMGGGGFWLLHRASDGLDVMIDGREVAPLEASRDMYLDDKGEVIPKLSIDGPLAAGIPGQPAALVHLANQYGKLPLTQTLAPAIRAAKQGFAVTEHYQRMAKFRLEALRKSPDAARIFLQDNTVPKLGYLIKQADLARTLEHIAREGHQGFYAGEVADKLVAGSRQHGGIWTREDLSRYEIKQRQPLVGEFAGYKIVTVPPPSSGGVALLTMLNILNDHSWQNIGALDRKHLLIESMRRAYRDRAVYLGDSDFIDVPVSRLISADYAMQLSADIDMQAATASDMLPGIDTQPKGNHTTHFSIIDQEGNRVAATLSVNYPFGACFVAPGTGILFNDEMDDFSAKPGVPNAYGLVGAEANAIAPGKRMLSSMSPTFIENNQQLAILGTPGGSRIITMVLLGMLGVSEGHSALEVVSQPRFHHQYLPDEVQYEDKAFTDQEIAQLEQRGHTLHKLDGHYGNMQMVILNKTSGQLTAASDPRGEGQAVVE